MKISKLMRKDILGIVKDALEYVSGTPSETDYELYIIFKNIAGETLCSIKFDALTYALGTGDVVAYEFTIGDPASNVLRGTVAKTDSVVSFSISGKPGTNPIDHSMITGTVGNKTSSADIKFNMLTWQKDTTITLTALKLIMNQGL